MMNETGKKLRELRGNTRREVVCAATGISTASLCAYENGTRNPKGKTRRALAEYYGRTVDDIFREEKSASP